MIDFDKVAKEMGWTQDKAYKFYMDLFAEILDTTRDPKLPTIHLQEFGKFYVKKSRIDRVIRAYIAQIRKGVNVERNKERIRSLWEARKSKSYKRV